MIQVLEEVVTLLLQKVLVKDNDKMVLVELKDGSVLFHDPMNPLANEQGLVPSTS